MTWLRKQILIKRERRCCKFMKTKESKLFLYFRLFIVKLDADADADAILS